MTADTAPPSVHADLSDLAPFLGTWRGRGEGHYPTIEPFAYVERVTFGHVGKPVLSYTQGTRHADAGHPMHAESGYLRPAGDEVGIARVEWTIAQPTGIVEVLEGMVELTEGGVVVDLASTSVSQTSSAKRVAATRRRYEVAGDRLTYDFYMAYGELPVTHHLHAELDRVDD